MTTQEEKAGLRGLKLRSFEAKNSGRLIGLCDVEIFPGFVLKDVRILLNWGHVRAVIPRRAVLDRLGMAKRDKNGLIEGDPCVTFDDEESYYAFSGLVVDAVRRVYPNLEADAAAIKRLDTEAAAVKRSNAAARA